MIRLLLFYEFARLPRAAYYPTLVRVQNILSYVDLYQVRHGCAKIQVGRFRKKSALYQASLVELLTGPKKGNVLAL
jgi:hypothetical protein